MSEYEIEFDFNGQTSKASFSGETELYELYVFCAKQFKCGFFALSFQSINLNFVNKNTKLQVFVPKNQKSFKMKVIIQKLDSNIEKRIKIKKNEKTTIIIKKGDISSIILQNSILSLKAPKIHFKGDLINKSEIFAFFTNFSNYKISSLKIPVNNLIDLENIHQKLKTNVVSKIRKLSVYGIINKFKDINLGENTLNNLSFQNTHTLKLKNVNVEFRKPFPQLNKLIAINAFGFNRYDIVTDYDNITHLELSYQFVDDLFEQLHFFSEKMQKLDTLKIKFNSLDITNLFDLQKFFNFKLFSISKEIYLNIKAKFEPIAIDKINKESMRQILSKVKELKLLPYSYFTENDFELFNTNMKALNLFKFKNYDIQNKAILDSFLAKCSNLEFLDLNTQDNNSPEHSFYDILYKINGYNNEILTKNIFSFFSFEKIEKIILPFIEFSKKKELLTLTGDCLPDKQEEIEEGLFILLKKILFATNSIKKLVIQNFDRTNISFLNRILSHFVNIISSPKVGKIKLINVEIEKTLIDKLSFIFMKSSPIISSIEINNITFTTGEAQFLFFNILFQIEYQNLKKFIFKNLKWDENISMIVSETNLISRIKILSFESIENFELIEEIINSPNLSGIELKNVPVTANQLTQVLSTNGKNYKWLSLDLDINIYPCLSSINIMLPSLETLIIGESFENNIPDKVKLDFLESKWKDMKKLKKIKIFFKNPNKERKKKICDLYKYLTKF